MPGNRHTFEDFFLRLGLPCGWVEACGPEKNDASRSTPDAASLVSLAEQSLAYASGKSSENSLSLS